jgi:hypothetical protein
MAFAELAAIAAGFVATGLVYLALGYSPLGEYLVFRIACLSVTYPRTPGLKELRSKPLLAIDFDTVDGDDRLLRSIQEHINIAISGFGNEVEPIVKCLLAHKREFFVDQVDNIVISNLGMEVLLIKMSPKGIERSLRVDSAAFRSRFVHYKLAIYAASVLTFALPFYALG